MHDIAIKKGMGSMIPEALRKIGCESTICQYFKRYIICMSAFQFLTIEKVPQNSELNSSGFNHNVKAYSLCYIPVYIRTLYC